MPSEIASGQTTEGLPVAPSLGPALLEARVPPERALVDARVVFICALSIVIAAAAGVVAQALTRLIGFVTNLAFYGRVSSVFTSPAANRLGPLVVLVPIAGAVVVGLMARYGSAAIRGHGIPEAMEQVLLNKSRIPARITLLKPVSAAISIGTGGPFGAEGPIIATGGAVGSLVGQLLHTTAVERKTLLAAGAAAGMTATFGSPVSAVLLAVELLLFELRPRSLIPVALAAAAAMAVRIGFVGITPAFAMPNIAQPGEGALAAYVLLGALVGVAAVAVTKVVYAIEDAFDHLPIHWMWWPAIGAVAVGVCGYFSPHTLGVGYDNIERILSGDFGGQALLVLGVLKFVSWSISLGSGTSGGTLAPLFTIGGALGSARWPRAASRSWGSTRASPRSSAWPPCSRAPLARSSPRWCSPSRPRGSRSGKPRDSHAARCRPKGNASPNTRCSSFSPSARASRIERAQSSGAAERSSSAAARSRVGSSRSRARSPDRRAICAMANGASSAALESSARRRASHSLATSGGTA